MIEIKERYLVEEVTTKNEPYLSLDIQDCNMNSDYFDEEITKELFAEGYGSNQKEFIREFKKRSEKVKSAITSILADTLSHSVPLDIDSMFHDEESK